MSETKKGIIISIIGTLFCLLVSFIYNVFGHGVVSFYMNYMFIIPLVCGIFYTILILLKKKIISRLGYNIFNSGVAILTTGFFLKGVFEIAGTESKYELIYDIAGYLFLLVGFIIIIGRKRNGKEKFNS